MAALSELQAPPPSAEEREVQKSYWIEHSSQPTVEAMMLDSKASEIDQLERPEVCVHTGSWSLVGCPCIAPSPKAMLDRLWQ
jgi:hypothetical protein